MFCSHILLYSTKLEEMKEVQSLRKRPHGVSVIGLALGTKISVEEEAVNVCINIF